jgi:hypothetical protein
VKPATEVGLLALPGVFGPVTEPLAACRESGTLDTERIAGGLDLVARLVPAATTKIVIKPTAKTTKWDAVSAKLNGDDVRDSPSLESQTESLSQCERRNCKPRDPLNCYLAVK